MRVTATDVLACYVRAFWHGDTCGYRSGLGAKYRGGVALLQIVLTYQI